MNKIQISILIISFMFVIYMVCVYKTIMITSDIHNMCHNVVVNVYFKAEPNAWYTIYKTVSKVIGKSTDSDVTFMNKLNELILDPNKNYSAQVTLALIELLVTYMILKYTRCNSIFSIIIKPMIMNSCIKKYRNKVKCEIPLGESIIESYKLKNKTKEE